MISPYDWQESISQRSQYIENRLRAGSPIIALALNFGTVLYTYRRHVRKIYEVYDQVMFSAIGAQADVENLRLAALDFAHREGFAKSEADVSVGRIVGFALSSPLKRAFGDLSTTPFVIRALFAEMGRKPSEDLFFSLQYDGDFEANRQFSAVGGTKDAEKRMMNHLHDNYKPDLNLESALNLCDEAWKIGADLDVSGEPDPEILRNAHPEIGVLDRESKRERRFQLLERQ